MTVCPGSWGRPPAPSRPRLRSSAARKSRRCAAVAVSPSPFPASAPAAELVAAVVAAAVLRPRGAVLAASPGPLAVLAASPSALRLS